MSVPSSLNRDGFRCLIALQCLHLRIGIVGRRCRPRCQQRETVARGTQIGLEERWRFVTGAMQGGEGRVARWDESGINASASGHKLALATCFPFDAIEPGPMRYIVTAELVGEQHPVPLTTGSVSK